MIVTRSYVRKLEFCNLIGAFTFQYAAILLDQQSTQVAEATSAGSRADYSCYTIRKNDAKVTRPFPRWEAEEDGHDFYARSMR